MRAAGKLGVGMKESPQTLNSGTMDGQLPVTDIVLLANNNRNLSSI